MKKSGIYLIPVLVSLLLFMACGGNKQQANFQENQQQTTQPESKAAASAANVLNLNGRDVKGTIKIDIEDTGLTTENMDTDQLSDKKIEILYMGATKWANAGIGIFPVKDSYDSIRKNAENTLKSDNDGIEILEKGTNSIFYHCSFSDLENTKKPPVNVYGFIVFVKGKSKSYEIVSTGDYDPGNIDGRLGFVESKEDAMKVYKIAQTFQPVE